MRYLGHYTEFKDGEELTAYAVQFDIDIMLHGVSVCTNQSALSNLITVTYGEVQLCRNVPDMGCVMEFKLRKPAILPPRTPITVSYVNSVGIDGGMATIIEGDGIA